MRLFRKITHVCQNCINSNNKKGKWKRTILRKDCNGHEGYWHIFCEKKQKYYRWDKYKKCFRKQETNLEKWLKKK